MDKREEIRKSIESVIADAMLGNFDEEDIGTLTNRLVSMLHSQGMVIKVDRESQFDANIKILDHFVIVDNGVEYVAVEPLIGTHCPVCSKEAHLCKCPVIDRGSFAESVELEK